MQWLACEIPPYSRAAATARSFAVFCRDGFRDLRPDPCRGIPFRFFLQNRQRHKAFLRQAGRRYISPRKFLKSSVFPCTKSAMIVDGAATPAMGYVFTAEKLSAARNS
jgi:hypothetical protein